MYWARPSLDPSSSDQPLSSESSASIANSYSGAGVCNKNTPHKTGYQKLLILFVQPFFISQLCGDTHRQSQHTKVPKVIDQYLVEKFLAGTQEMLQLSLNRPWASWLHICKCCDTCMCVSDLSLVVLRRYNLVWCWIRVHWGLTQPTNERF